MGRIDHLGAGHEMADVVRREERVERQAPVGFSSVSRGALRIASAEGLIVEGSARVSGQLIVTGTETVDGTLVVTGTERVDGTLQVDGHLIVGGDTVMTGPFRIDGATTINGNTAVNGEITVNGKSVFIGPTFIIGALDVAGVAYLRGATEVTGDLTVTSAGKINVGNMAIGEGTHGDGKGVSFSNGSALSAIGDGVQVYSASNGLLSMGSSQTSLHNGVHGITLNSNGVKLTTLSLNAALTPNVHIDATGRLWRTS